MNLRKPVSTTIATVSLLAVSSWAHAIPTLQLGIAGGTYDSFTDTVIASNSSFSLYAYLIANLSNPIGDTYTVSMALSPQVNSAANLGSFIVNGVTIHATSDMTYGIPPLDATVETTTGGDNHDLQTHSVFPTFFIERSFSFSAADQSAAFNTEGHPSFGPQAGTGMYFKKFDVDVTNLDQGYSIHFDLFNTEPITEKTCSGKGQARECTTTPTGELDITQFAPFGHDAQSGPGDSGGGNDEGGNDDGGNDDGGNDDSGSDDGGNQVPEPASMFLIGLGLVGLGWTRKAA